MGCCGKKVKNIATGWASLLTQTADLRAQERLRVCKNCDRNRWKGLKMWCRECRCYIPAKARVADEECPLGKWTRNEPNPPVLTR